MLEHLSSDESLRHYQSDGKLTEPQLPRFEIRLGKLRKTGDPNHPYEQKGVDVLMSIDITHLSVSNTIQRAIIITGDSDFCPAIKMAKEKTLIKLVYYLGTAGNELRDLRAERMEIDQELIDKVKL